MLSYTVTYLRKQFADRWSAVPGGRNYPSKQFPIANKRWLLYKSRQLLAASVKFTPSIRFMRKGDGPNWASTPCCGIMSPQETVGAPLEYPWVCWTGARINSNNKTLPTAAAEAQTNAAFPLDGMLKTDLTSVAYLPTYSAVCVCVHVGSITKPTLERFVNTHISLRKIFGRFLAGRKVSKCIWGNLNSRLSTSTSLTFESWFIEKQERFLSQQSSM